MADSATILSSIIEAISSHTEIDASALTADTRLDSLDVSSFDFLEIVFNIEERFNVQLDVNTMDGISTIGELAGIASQQIEAASRRESA